jgi:hypothetical protein
MLYIGCAVSLVCKQNECPLHQAKLLRDLIMLLVVLSLTDSMLPASCHQGVMQHRHVLIQLVAGSFGQDSLVGLLPDVALQRRVVR